MFRPEILNGVQMHIGQFRLHGWLAPQLGAASHRLEVLKRNPEHIAAVLRLPLARIVINVPCFVNELILLSALEATTSAAGVSKPMPSMDR